MTAPRIVTLVGGISQNSLNRKLYLALKDLVGSKAEFIFADIASLPFFSKDLENDPPDSVVEYKDQIRWANGILFVTPEYNRSIPGVLKNAIDWGTRPYPDNLWENKPVATIGASTGNTGTFGAQNHLRQILSYLNMYVLNQPEFYMNGSKAFDEDDKLIDKKTRDHLIKMWDAFEVLIQSHTSTSKNQLPHDVENSTWVQH